MTKELLEELDPHDHSGLHGADLRQDIELKRRYGVIQVWLAATLLELVGVVLVVTRYLFPRRDLVAPAP